MRVEKLLVTQLVNCINENKDDIGLPCYVTFGAPQTLTGEAMWLQTLGGTREIKKYIRGKYKGELSFAVYYRLSAVQMDGIEANLIVPHSFRSGSMISTIRPSLTDLPLKIFA